MEEIDNTTKEITIHLRDYLSPGGLYNYDLLPAHCEKWLSKGYKVSVVSVPGFLMFTGWPNRKGKKWSKLDMGKFREYKTAYEALKR